MKALVFIAVGGAVGAVLRYGASLTVYSLLGRGFPYGTLFVNVSGSLLMGRCDPGWRTGFVHNFFGLFDGNT